MILSVFHLVLHGLICTLRFENKYSHLNSSYRYLAKQVKKYSEEAKVAMRNIRRDGMDYVKKLKKNSEITEDDQKKAEKDLQDLLDKNIKRADAALAAKEKELMAI